MIDRNLVLEQHPTKIGWYAGAAIFLAAALALFLYADGYFDGPAPNGQPAEENIIVGQ